MSLVLHQLRLELRRTSGMLVLYLLLLACNFAVVAGSIGLEPPFPGSEYWGGQGVFNALLVIGFWALFARSRQGMFGLPCEP